MHPTLASHICTSDCVHFIRSWCIYSVVSWLIIFSVICIPIIHCALHGLVDDRCNLRRYNSSTFYNPYLCPLPTKPCISCTIATRVINNWTSHTAHVTQRTVYCEDFTADPSVNAVCRYRGASLCFPMEISLTSPISAPRNLHLCPMPTSNQLHSSPHAALQLQHMQVAALQLLHKIARGRWRGDGSLGSWNGSGWFWICRADLKFSHSCKVWDYNLVALCSQSSKWSRMKLKNKSCLSFQVWLSSRCSADPRPTCLVLAVLQRCCWHGWCWCHLFW